MGDAPGVFRLHHTSFGRAYCQCLMALGQFHRSGLEALPEHQCCAHCSAMLASSEPGLVPVGLPAKAYADLAILAQAKVDANQAAPAVPVAAAAIACGSGSESEEPWRAPRVPRHWPEAESASGGEADTQPMPHGLVRGTLADAGAGVPVAERPQAEQPVWAASAFVRQARGSGRRASSSQSSSSSSASSSARSSARSSASSSASQSSSSSSALENHGPQQRLPKLEGVLVAVDVHGEPGTAGHYRRYVVKCVVPEHGPACIKRRNVGEMQTRQCGEKEPLGFLGVWLQCGPLFPDRASHMRFRPSAGEVRAYLDEGNAASV